MASTTLRFHVLSVFIRCFLIFSAIEYRNRIVESNDTCDGFMSVLAPRRPWKDENEPCIYTFYQQDENIALLSSQMKAMNASLTIYSGYERHALCNFTYSNVHVEYFDAKALLIEYGFGDLIAKMSRWDYIGYTRASDILRILLALRYNKSYIDTDVHFLQLDRDLYMRSYVGAALWSEEKSAVR